MASFVSRIVKALGSFLITVFLLCLLAAWNPPAAAKTSDIASGEPYTIAWLSDTQRYSASYPQIFLAMTNYLRGEKDKLNLGYVVLTGDIVSKAGSAQQWQNAKAAMDRLDPIPYGVLAGNHDRNKKIGYDNFSNSFGERFFSGKPHFGGSYKDNRGHYDLITMGKTDYLFVYLGFQPNQESMDWANSVFQKYPKRVGVLCVHDYLNSKSKPSGMGKTLQKKVLAVNPNLYLVLSGHRYTQDCVPISFDDNGDGKYGRTVYQCIANYQTLQNGGSGYMRFMQINEAKGELRFYTYSPFLDEYREPPKRAINKQDVWPIPWKS